MFFILRIRISSYMGKELGSGRFKCGSQVLRGEGSLIFRRWSVYFTRRSKNAALSTH